MREDKWLKSKSLDNFFCFSICFPTLQRGALQYQSVQHDMHDSQRLGDSSLMNAYTCFKSLYLLHLIRNIKFKMRFTFAPESLPGATLRRVCTVVACSCFYILYSTGLF
jgi:hypothetical protein